MNPKFIALLAATLVLQTAVYALRPMVSYQAIAFGANNWELGVVAAAYATLSLVVAVPIGRWVDRWGEPIFIVVGAVTTTGVALALLMIDSLVALILSQAALGFGHIAAVVGSQSLTANLGAADRRDHRFGAFTVIVSLGQLVGPALGGIIAGSQTISLPALHRVYWVVAATSLLGVLVAVWLLSTALPGRRSAAGGRPATTGTLDALGKVLRIHGMPHAMIASLTVLTTIDLITVYLPAYGETHGMSIKTVGLLLSVRAAASMASRIGMVSLIRAFGRKRLLIASISAPALMIALLTFPLTVPVLLGVMVIAGLGLGLGQPVTLSWVADRAPDNLRGTALGVRLSGNRLGQVALPLIVGGIAGTAGLGAVWLSLSVLLAGSAVTVRAASFDLPA